MNKLIRAVQVTTYKGGDCCHLQLCEKGTQLKKTSYVLTDNSSTEQPGSCICQCPQFNTWDSLRFEAPKFLFQQGEAKRQKNFAL